MIITMTGIPMNNVIATSDNSLWNVDAYDAFRPVCDGVLYFEDSERFKRRFRACNPGHTKNINVPEMFPSLRQAL